MISLIGKPHLSLYYVLEQLQMEAKEIDKEISRLSAGHSPAKKKKSEYEEKDRPIQRFVGR